MVIFPNTSNSPMNSRLLTDLRCWLTVCLLLTFSFVSAQRNVHIHTRQLNTVWDFPVSVDLTDEISFSESLVLFHLKDGKKLSFSTDVVDSLTFTTTPDSEDKNPYRVFQLNITTTNGTAVTSKEDYVPCFISLGARGSFSDYSGSASIRCRGNSSFRWYDKKPYRIKLDTKHKLLGLEKAKSWVLLANYRDVTDMMNTFVFEMGRALGLPYTNHTRYVELFLNGDYKGIYQLTEQIQQNKNRVAVSDEHGILIALDVDDGPGESPYANDNFWSSVYRMPVCVKYPDDERWTVNTVDSVRRVFAELETAIKNKDYAQVQQLLDVSSFIKYLLIQEFVYNVELSAPRSIYMHKDGDGPWVMGPLWDFDAGYDFDWGQMTTGHTFFTDFTETVMGSNPLKRNGQYSYVPQFFTDLFACPEFVEAYKAQWAAVKDTIVTHAWDECMRYVEQMRASGAIDREFQRWPISRKRFDTELDKMQKWLQNRRIHFSYLVAAIPVPK